MLQPADIRLEEGAQVRHAVFQHGDAVDAHAPGETLDAVGVEAAVAQDVGVHHPAPAELEALLDVPLIDTTA